MGVSFLKSTPVRAEAGNTQTHGVTDVEAPQDRPKCEYAKEGMCLTHMKQATERFKASWVTKPGPGGRIMKRYQKKYYWQCDLDPRSGKTLKQSRLSFPKKPSVVQQGGRDTRGGEENSFVTTPSGGKGDVELNKGEKKWAGIKNDDMIYEWNN